MSKSEEITWLLVSMGLWAPVLAALSLGALFSGGNAGFEFVNALAHVTWWLTGAFALSLSWRLAYVAGSKS